MISQDALVLIGEDEPDNRIILQTVVESLLGVRAEVAGDGLAVLACVERERPKVILLDLMMPVMNGWALCQEIKSRDDLREIPVVLMSADRRLDRKVQEAQADDHLRKPFDLAALYEVVGRYLPAKQ